VRTRLTFFRSRQALALVGPAVLVLAGAGCGGDDSPSVPSRATALACDDGIRTAFKPDANTSVLLVKSFKAGDVLQLDPAVPSVGTTAVDVCLVKLLIGPGKPGPAGAPSTSAGIGIEVWLPSVANWDATGNVIRAFGSGGWAGGFQTDLKRIGSFGTPLPNSAQYYWIGAVEKGYVVSTSDHGHFGPNANGGNGSFALNEDGSINTVLWKDYAERSMHEQAEKTKALTQAYYAKAHQYAYWDGFSTGGRQGLTFAQRFPDDFDGILAGAPANNMTKFITAELYPQIVMQRDLGGLLPVSKQNAVSGLATASCGGSTLGFLVDPTQCRYDPTRDAAALCSGVTGLGGVIGSNADTAKCVTLAEAHAINKMWFGQTADGSYVDPANDNGTAPSLASSNHLWFGFTRGSFLGAMAGTNPFPIASTQVALSLQNAAYAQSTPPNTLTNAAGANLGADLWKTLDYGALANAFYRGIALQASFGNINMDDADLSAFAKSGAKLLQYHGWTDNLIMPQGSVHYYARVSAQAGGLSEVQKFHRLFMIPGYGHSSAFTGTGAIDATGNALALAHVPLPQHTVTFAGGVPAGPGRDELFETLRAWVERGTAPERIELTSPSGAVTMPICAYPKKATHDGAGPLSATTSYACR
jgi:hypothetical protein